MNVQSIHNASFNQSLDPSWIRKAQDLANFHEWITFTDSSPGGIGNSASSPVHLTTQSLIINPFVNFTVDGQTVLPSILTALQSISNTSNPLKLHYTALSYKPFISLVNMTSDPASPVGYRDFGGGINLYASALVFEVYQNDSLRMRYKNGTGLVGGEPEFVTMPLNSSMNTVSGFVKNLEVSSTLL
jgi:prostatic aicd phosphatase